MREIGRSEILHATDDRMGVDKPSVIDEEFVRAMHEAVKEKSGEEPEQKVERLMRVAHQVESSVLPNDSRLLRFILQNLREARSAIETWERKQREDWQNTNPRRLLSEDELQEVGRVFSKIRHAGWNVYRKDRLAEDPSCDPEVPPGPPVDDRLLGYISALHEFDYPEDVDERMRRLEACAQLIAENPLPDDKQFVSNFFHHLKNAYRGRGTEQSEIVTAAVRKLQDYQRNQQIR